MPYDFYETRNAPVTVTIKRRGKKAQRLQLTKSEARYLSHAGFKRGMANGLCRALMLAMCLPESCALQRSMTLGRVLAVSVN